jgi:hypothetical protein
VVYLFLRRILFMIRLFVGSTPASWQTAAPMLPSHWYPSFDLQRSAVGPLPCSPAKIAWRLHGTLHRETTFW